MALSEEFEAKAEGVIHQLHTLVDDNLPWRADLQAALSSIQFTPEQEQAIRDKATPTTFQDMGGGEAMNDFSTRITHAFRDSIANTTMLLEMVTMSGDEEQTLNTLTQIKMNIQDLEHNYPLMLGENLPESVEQVLDTYEAEILPQINGMIDELAQSTGIDPNNIPYNSSYQHITALPEDVFVNTATHG